VVVALRAAKGRAQPHRGRRIDAIDQILPVGLFLVDSAFLVEHRVAVEARGNPLRHVRIRQHVPRYLLDREPVEGLVTVQGLDHPVAILPHRSSAVLLVAVAVGIAREIEPRPRPPLAIVR